MFSGIARKSEVLRLAGLYDNFLPDLPLPATNQGIGDPKSRAKAAYLWTSALQVGSGLEKARPGLKKMEQVMQ